MAEVLRPLNPPLWGTLKKDSNWEAVGTLGEVVFNSLDEFSAHSWNNSKPHCGGSTASTKPDPG